MKILLVLISSIFVTTAPLAFPQCHPVPGAGQIWSQSSVTWVWVGETHGTAETPAVFGNLVCEALSHGRHVTVALERPATEQSAIDAVIGSGDREAGAQKLLNQPDWRNVYDGRTSQAMLQLLFSLRELKVQYPSLRVVAVVDPSAFGSSPAADDEAMGHSVLALDGKRPGDLVMVLTGNVHGLMNPIFGYKTAAMYLPPNRLVSLQVTDAGGETWKMNDKGCGASSGGVPDKSKRRPFGVYLDSGLARVGKVNGILALGKPTTASWPANTSALAAAPCRRKFISQSGGQSSHKSI